MANSTLYSPSTAGLRKSGAGKPRSIGERLIAWFDKRSEQVVDRMAFDTLTRLDDRQLRDIGLTRDDVDWASRLPLSQDAAEALKRRRSNF